MTALRSASIALFCTMALIGCSDEIAPTAPATPEETLANLSAGDARLNMSLTEPVSKHLFVFKGRAPGDFEARVEELGGTVTLNHAIGIAVARGLDSEDAAGLESVVGAQFVEEAPEFQLIEPAALGQPTALMQASASPSSVEDPSSAILFANQWNMRQIHADEAWAAGHLGSADVTVAILDTGIDYMLPDLAGLVDLERSVSFEPNDDLFTELFFPGRHPSTDLHFHGTNVATQVASNAWAFAGVTSKTTLMSVKVCSVLGGCHGVIEGILYAIDNGADVINMSLGGWFSKAAYPGAVSAYNSIMNYARQQGVTIVVAAGNDANNLNTQKNIAIKDAAGNIIDRVHVPSFFATYCDARAVICVSATRDNDIPAGYTNYGRSAIDVAAPGGGGGDWVYALCPQTSLVFNCAGGYYPLGVAGTSQATPHVSGLAALMVAKYGRNPSKIKNAIKNSADDLGQSGNDPYFGSGRINVAAALGLN
ncbi:MAG TPA: S8 family serine peptidase [Longimicrobiaceae bacterium]|nr:S8 family serine peptidase [Longimicrobiaceae bacterium]